MDTNVCNYHEISTDEILQKIRNRESFKINKVPFGAYQSAVEHTETLIKSVGFKCWVYTVGGIGAVAPTINSGIGTVIGIETALTIAKHNRATRGPDYEIGRNLYGCDVEVTYKKKQALSLERPGNSVRFQLT
ncbi:hypothetical protein ACN1C3_06135 [Pseudomonas sp. H11T01]|uniref:hypothetical protein n=1 Tax=Pseudomonas sp. H11T01 TaxID=3402749 RepID=UPI003ABF70E3